MRQYDVNESPKEVRWPGDNVSYIEKGDMATYMGFEIGR
jgi:hypothetical protein